MYATVNLPGSSHFSYFHGTKKECQEWLDEQKRIHQTLYQGAWTSTYFPAEIVSDKKALRWRYRDGNPVIRVAAQGFEDMPV